MKRMTKKKQLILRPNKNIIEYEGLTFKNKTTKFKKIDGVEYISKDVHNTIFVDFVKKLKEEINKGLHKGNCSCDRCDARRQDLFDITKIMGEIKK